MTTPKDARLGEQHASHTPGPWTIDRSMGCVRHNGLVVCDLRKLGNGFTALRQEADARLIAAAPRMKQLVQQLADAQGVDPDRCKRWTLEARALLRELGE